MKEVHNVYHTIIFDLPAISPANLSLEFAQNHSLLSRLFFPYQPLNTGDDSHEPVVPATCQIQKFSVDRRRGHVAADGNVGMDGKHMKTPAI